MKRIALIIMVFSMAWSCKNDPKPNENTTVDEEVITESEPSEVTNDGDVISKIAEAHGGMEKWNGLKSVYFEIERSDYQEKYTIDLDSRNVRIEYKDHILGKDGETLWVKNLGTEDFKGKAEDLHNFMYYLHFMPFIIMGDAKENGSAPVLTYDGKEFPGVAIKPDPEKSGKTENDEFIIYYNPDTYQMEWLAYKVNYFTESKEVLYTLIKYHDWETVDGLVLPSVVQWHIFDKGEIKDQINEMFYQNTKLMTEAADASLFAKPADSKLASEIKK
ncbi:MAG: hypothetical protein HKO96_05305 [Flavobacteriaceae bacterium]|nr:hypothetical protein [Flavobacteriaceae bacterium]